MKCVCGRDQSWGEVGGGGSGACRTMLPFCRRLPLCDRRQSLVKPGCGLQGSFEQLGTTGVGAGVGVPHPPPWDPAPL